MINSASLGNFTLNLAFVLYLFVYVPQIRHNNNKQHLAELNISLHCILMVSFVLDLIYALLTPLPWQYSMVAIFSLSTLSLQHLQLLRIVQQRSQILLLSVLSLFLFSFIIILFFFYYRETITYSSKMIILIGWISRIGFLSYTLPQIIQNYRLRSATALSTMFLILSFILSLLDFTSAWCLNWGWPNKLGALFTITLTFVLLWQKKHYALNKSFF